MSQVFQQIQLKNNLLLLSVLTLIKDYIVQRNKDDAADESKSEEENKHESDDEFLMDYEFINWIAKLALSNTNMNAYWKITHLRSYLVSLLLREGFENLKTNDLDEMNEDISAKKTDR